VSIRSRYESWQRERKRFPTVWLSYRARIKKDVELAYKLKGGQEFFDEKFLSSLNSAVKVLDGWILKLLLGQITIGLFLLDWLLSGQAHGSILGVSIQSKEFLLVLSALIGLLVYIATGARDLRVWIAHSVVEASTNPAFADLAKVASTNSFYIVSYGTKHYANWIFPRLITRISFGLILLLGLLIAIGLFIVSIVGYAYILFEIYRHPTLPGHWTTAAVYFALAVQVLGIIWAIRFHLPLPYEDKGKLLQLQRVEKSDPAQYQKLLQEIFPKVG
jgi:hypothetical protein